MKRILYILILVFYSVGTFAHVVLEPKEAAAGSYAKLSFAIPHGCSGSPTTEVSIEIPEGIIALKPQVHSAWKIQTEKEKHSEILLHGKSITESVRRVIWKGELADDYSDELSIRVKLPEKPRVLYFPTTQFCKKGKIEWSQISTKNEHLEFPAPKLKLTPASKHSH
jgi:periplasmic copper chaperone A